MTTRPRKVSPGRVGTCQRRFSIPPPPIPAVRESTASTYIRIQSDPVCQPLAISPRYGLLFAASGSMWKYCGSQSRAKAMISSWLTVRSPSSNT
jgi:hypothetical protein